MSPAKGTTPTARVSISRLPASGKDPLGQIEAPRPTLFGLDRTKFIGAVIAATSLVVGIAWAWKLSLAPQCHEPSSQPPYDDAEGHNLCWGVSDGICVAGAAGSSVSGQCKNNRMHGEWKAQLGIGGASWKGTYCNGKPCGEFLIKLDQQHVDRRLYSADGAGPTGTWLEWAYSTRGWCSATGEMGHDGMEGMWVLALDGKVWGKGKYLHGRKVGSWEYDCGNGARTNIEHPTIQTDLTPVECLDLCPSLPVK